MERQNSFELLLNSKSFSIQSKFDRLTKVSSNVYDQLIFNCPHQYIIKSNVSETVLSSFINYWVHEEIPNINIHNFYEYYNLSQEFGLLTEILEKKKEEFGKDLEFYNGLLNQDNQYQSYYEEQVSQNLDEYLDRYGNEMMKLPMNVLFNIFNHTKCSFTNHNLAYNLIQIEFERSNDPQIFALLSCLDGTKLSEKNLENAICCRDLHYNFMPKIDSSCISSAMQKQREIENQIFKLNMFINEQKSEMKHIEEEMSSNKADQEEEIRDLKELIKNQSNEISNSEEKSAKQVYDIKKLLREQAIKIETIDEKKSNEIDELKKILSYNNKTISELKKINSEQNEEILSCKKAIAKLIQIQENDTSKEEIEKLKELVKLQSDKIEKMENEHADKIKSLKEIINENKAKTDDKLKAQEDDLSSINSTLGKLVESFKSFTSILKRKSKSSTKSQSNNSTTQDQNHKRNEVQNCSTSKQSYSSTNTTKANPKSSSLYEYAYNNDSQNAKHVKISPTNDQKYNYYSTKNYKYNYDHDRSLFASPYGQQDSSPLKSDSQNNSFVGIQLNNVRDEDLLSPGYDRINFYSSGMTFHDSSDSDTNSVKSLYDYKRRDQNIDTKQSSMMSNINPHTTKYTSKRKMTKKRIVNGDQSSSDSETLSKSNVW